MGPKALRNRTQNLILAALLLLLAGCGRMQAAAVTNSNPDVKVTLNIEPVAPAEKQTSTLLVSLAQPDGTPLEGAQVSIEGNMTHAGMVPVVAAASPAGAGSYQASMTWNMAGDWQVTVKADLADGRKLQRQFPVRVVGMASQ